jgi:hypothetical protein
MTSSDFAAATLPWVDRDSFADDLGARRASGAVGEEDAATLESWRETGYHLPRGAVDHQLIDRLLSEYEEAWLSHYSTVSGYPRDRRSPDRVPPRIEKNGGVLYLRQGPPGPLARLRSLLGRVRRKIFPAG